jgi:hypothetical protein
MTPEVALKDPRVEPCPEMSFRRYKFTRSAPLLGAGHPENHHTQASQRHRPAEPL